MIYKGVILEGVLEHVDRISYSIPDTGFDCLCIGRTWSCRNVDGDRKVACDNLYNTGNSNVHLVMGLCG